MLADIFNYLELGSGLGTAGQPEPSQFAEIKAAGYEIIINLVPPVSPDFLPDEEALVKGLGLEYVHIPVIWTAPTLQDLDRFFATVRANKDRKVFIHCVMNFRVSAFMFLYRVLQEHVPEEIARQPMSEIWEPNQIWQDFIQGAIDAYRTTNL